MASAPPDGRRHHEAGAFCGPTPRGLRSEAGGGIVVPKSIERGVHGEATTHTVRLGDADTPHRSGNAGRAAGPVIDHSPCRQDLALPTQNRALACAPVVRDRLAPRPQRPWQAWCGDRRPGIRRPKQHSFQLNGSWLSRTLEWSISRW